VFADPPQRWLGHGPVVLVGGFCATGVVLGPMRRWLERLGYAVTTHTVGAGLDCAGRSVAALDETVHAVAGAHGEPVRLVAHSRGGQFARAVARRTDVPLHGLVTLGTPLDLYGINGALMLQAAAVAAAGTLGAPGLASLACLDGHEGRAVPRQARSLVRQGARARPGHGRDPARPTSTRARSPTSATGAAAPASLRVAGALRRQRLGVVLLRYGPCCAEFRAGLRAPVPVPVTAVYSRDDRAVPWQAAADPAARNVEVPGSHLGLLIDPPALCSVAEALAV
jgi:pimeloyl-ACP methyl ester carboxylesterase